jgi:glycosyltransferase involved in cell wall biosynthesis
MSETETIPYDVVQASGPAQLLNKSITIIIPAFNEEAGIFQTLSSLCAEPALKNVEIIVIDDGSSDRTCEMVRSFEQVRLIQHPFNRGYGSAICTGARAARGDYILWFDSDGQHQVEDLLKVATKLTEEQYDYCIGVRDKTSYQDPDRKFGKWLLKLAVDFSVGRPAPDFNSGLRGFRKDVLLRYLHLLPKRFGASTLTTLLMIEGDHYGTTVPITVQPRVGKSTVRQFQDGMRTLEIILHIAILFKPLKFFGMIGLALILLGGLYGLWKAIVNQLGIPTLASVIILLGVQSFFFGLLCDQISALRRERFS